MHEFAEVQVYFIKALARWILYPKIHELVNMITVVQMGQTLGEWGYSWRVGVLLESGGTLGEWGYPWRVGVPLES